MTTPITTTATTVRSVLGDVPAGRLGVTSAHDHLMSVSPKMAGQELDDAARACRRWRHTPAAGHSLSRSMPRSRAGAEWVSAPTDR